MKTIPRRRHSTTPPRAQIVDSYCMCLFWIGFGSFALVETVFSLISLMYTLPLLVTLWLPIFILFLSIPLAVYCILFPIIVGGDDEKRIRYVDSITVSGGGQSGVHLWLNYAKMNGF